MESRVGRFLLALLPKVRKLKDDSVLGRFVDAVGTSLDTAKEDVFGLRRRGFLQEIDPGHAYYTSSLRTEDLSAHALDRGTRRLKGESNSALAERLKAMPYARQFAGSAMGMKYLVEEVLGHTLVELAVFSDDPKKLVLVSAREQPTPPDLGISHIYSAQDQDMGQEEIPASRWNRLYSTGDVQTCATFFMAIQASSSLSSEAKRRIVELVHQEKPAHTKASIYVYP